MHTDLIINGPFKESFSLILLVKHHSTQSSTSLYRTNISSSYNSQTLESAAGLPSPQVSSGPLTIYPNKTVVTNRLFAPVCTDISGLNDRTTRSQVYQSQKGACLKKSLKSSKAGPMGPLLAVPSTFTSSKGKTNRL